MDDRQSGIKEGAGLEDSRVNQEFIDFLNKWSTPVIMTLAIAALVWAGLQKLDRMKTARVDQAFSELAATTQGGNPSPASLKLLADEFEGVRSISEMALLTASDLYLSAFVTGVNPGSTPDQMTGAFIEPDLLDDSQRQAYLEQAGQAAQRVLDSSNAVAGKELIAMQAMSRLAAIAEGKRDFDGAKAMYGQLQSKATATSFPSIAQFAANRIDQIAEIKDLGSLPAQELISTLPGEDAMPTQEQIQEMLNKIQNETPVVESDAIIEPASDDAVEGDIPEVPVETPAEIPAEAPESP